MSELECDVKNGFHIRRQERPTVGYIYKFVFDPKEKPTALKADFNLLNPEDPNKKDEVVAVLEQVLWDNNALGALTLKARFSEDNIGVLDDTLFNFGDSQPIIAVGFAVWKFHNKENNYYPMMGSDKKGRQEITGKLSSEYLPNHDQAYEISRNEDPFISHPANFVATIKIQPHPASNEMLIMATDAQTKRPQQWGVPAA